MFSGGIERDQWHDGLRNLSLNSVYPDRNSHMHFRTVNQYLV